MNSIFEKFKQQSTLRKIVISFIALFVMAAAISGLVEGITNTVKGPKEEEVIEEKPKEEKEEEVIEEEKEDEDEFIKEAKKKSDEKKAKDEAEKVNEVSQEEWNEFKTKFLEHYGEAGILDLQENPGSDYQVFNVYVPNEFKMNTEEEKQYYVEEIGPFMQEDLEAQFPDSELIHVYFKYQDDTTMAKAKMFGGWKIK